MNNATKHCSVDRCLNKYRCVGYCSKHYQRFRKHGDPLLGGPKVTTDCSVEGCENEHYGRGYCDKHWKRWNRHGDPLGGGSAHYTNPEDAFLARIKQVGSCLIWTGAKDQYGYSRLRYDGENRPAYRYAWERANGPIPKGMRVDHKFHCDPACVNIEHLRLATQSQNGLNRSGPTVLSTSGIRNVFWSKQAKKWMVTMQKGGQRHYFGTYDSKAEAAVVAEHARQELFGEFAGRG